LLIYNYAEWYCGNCLQLKCIVFVCVKQKPLPNFIILSLVYFMWISSEDGLLAEALGGCFRSQWPRGLRGRSAAARLLKLWDWILPGTWMSLCCDYCVLSGRGFCDELITRPEESYRLWCVVVCDLETSWIRRPWPTGGNCAKNGDCCYLNKFAYNKIGPFDRFCGLYIEFQRRNTHKNFIIVGKINQNLKFRPRECWGNKVTFNFNEAEDTKTHILTHERMISRSPWLLFRKFIVDWNFRIYYLNFRQLGCYYSILVHFSSLFLTTSTSRRHIEASLNNLCLNRTFLPTHQSSTDYGHFELFSRICSFLHRATVPHLVSPDTELV
jgi:hypothetical protein